MSNQTMIQPPSLTAFTWRPAERRDASAIQQLLAADLVADGRAAAPSLAEIELLFDELKENVATDTLLALDDGRLLAFAALLPQPSENVSKIQILGQVHSDYRRQGVGGFLLRWAEERAQQRFLPETGQPISLQVGCTEQMVDRLALFEKHDYQPLRYFYKMRCDLAGTIPERPLPDGVRVHGWSPELDAVMMNAFNDAFRDHWGFFPVDRETWQRWFTGPDFRGDLSFLAIKDGQALGFCLCSVKTAEIAETGVKEGWINDVGVIRAARRQGIAAAMLCHAMRAFRGADLDFAGLGVDTENPSGALGLYEKLGFEAVQRTITLAKPLQK